MSYYAVLDDDNQTGGDIATVSGYADFGRWIDGLKGELTQLRQLRNDGLSDDLGTLHNDLADAIEAGGSADVLDIATGIMQLLGSADSAQVLVITDGAGVEGADADTD